MKIASVSTVFGAVIEAESARTILDIGTGTGLLSLMLAQRSQARIVAVEIDTEAAVQAKENFESSPWLDRISVVESDIAILMKENKTDLFPVFPFDCIVCNPPFFQKKHPSPHPQRNQARHTESLTPELLAETAKAWLTGEGTMWLLIAYETTPEYCSIMTQNDLFPVVRYEIKDNPSSTGISCSILQCSRFPVRDSPPVTIYLRDSANQHSPQVRMLLKEYLIIF